MEIWRDALVDGYKGLYQASNHGRVRSTRFDTLHVMALRFHKDGYLVVDFRLNGKRRTLLVHRLVLSAFTNVNYDYDMQVNHKDGIKNNNHRDNLEWVTASENMQHAYDNGLRNIPHYEVYDKETNELVFVGNAKNCGLFMGRSVRYLEHKRANKKMQNENEKYYWKKEKESENA